ncbi:unnamed protein product [Blepharisma stoltei]|uniref:PHD-type domain-containing protein n=1 Tax=Blepharisma stoltei TaxID=1481888 RepID=A0AAU9IAI2_9CILI|nr:unnamed protein product [Blepharisma stoltei]
MLKQPLAPISILKEKPAKKHTLPHVKGKPQILYKYKSSAQKNILQKELSPETFYIKSIDYKTLSKSLQAYLEISHKKNSIRPDKFAYQEKQFPNLNEKPQTTNENQNVAVENTDGSDLYCICKRPYVQGEIMFKCEGFCGNWYHPECINLHNSEIERQLNSSERWYCPNCMQAALEVVDDSGLSRENRKSRFK